MPWPGTQDRVEGDNSGTSDEGLRPFGTDAVRELLAATHIPCLLLLGKGSVEGLLTLVVPSCGNRAGTRRRRAAALRGGRRSRGGILWPKDIETLQTRRPFRSGFSTSVLQSAAKPPLIQVFDAANGQDADREGRIIEYVVDQLGRDRKAVEQKDLYIPEDVETPKAGEDTAQRTGVKAASGMREKGVDGQRSSPSARLAWMKRTHSSSVRFSSIWTLRHVWPPRSMPSISNWAVLTLPRSRRRKTWGVW